MPDMPPTFRPQGQRTKRERSKEDDARRGSARERGYTTRWDKASKGHLRSHPLCAYHQLSGQVCEATLVDHLHPHKGDQSLFWDRRNWVPCCKGFHDRDKQAIERRGQSAIDGLARELGRPTLAELRKSDS